MMEYLIETAIDYSDANARALQEFLFHLQNSTTSL
jgi:hypothetical protein